MSQKEKIVEFIHSVMDKPDTVPDAVGSLFAENAIIHSIVEPQVGAEGMAKHCSSFLHAIPDLELTSFDILDGDKGVGLRWYSIGTHQQNFYGIEPTHNRIEYGGMAFFRFNDAGSVDKYAVAVDMFDIMQQMGMQTPVASLSSFADSQSVLIEALQKFGQDHPILSKEQVICLTLWMHQIPSAAIALQLSIPKQQVDHAIHQALHRLDCSTPDQLKEKIKSTNLLHVAEDLFNILDK